MHPPDSEIKAANIENAWRDYYSRQIQSDMEHDMWSKKVLALGLEKFIEGRLKGLDTCKMNGKNAFSKKELQDMRLRLEALFIRIEKEQNEQPTKKGIEWNKLTDQKF